MSRFESITIREVESSDLETFYEHQLDPEAIRMAAFVGKDLKDKVAFDAQAKRITFFLLRVVAGLLFLQAGGVKMFDWFGGVPAEYVGTWRASFDTADGTNSRTMTITQGSTGNQVMTLSGTGPNYDCRWSATLRASGPPLELGPTQVTFGDPKQCSPGQWSRLDMPDDSTIVRELVGSGGAPLTYTKTS